MARIRRDRYGHLYLEYDLDERRVHEYTDLPDTPANRATLARRLIEVVAQQRVTGKETDTAHPLATDAHPVPPAAAWPAGHRARVGVRAVRPDLV